MTASNITKLSAGKRVEHPEIYFSVSRRADSLVAYCGTSSGHVVAIDFGADEPQPRVLPATRHQSYVTGAAITDNSLVTGSYDRQLIWWNLDGEDVVRSFQAHDKWIRKVVASPDGSLVASVADDMRCRLWSVQTGELVHDLAGHDAHTPHDFPSMLFTCCFSTDGQLAAAADKVGHIAIWEAHSGKLRGSLDSPEHYTWDPVQRRHSIGGIRSIAFSPDDRLLAVGGISHIDNIDHLGGKSLVHVFDWQSGERTHKFEHDKHQGLIEQLRFCRDGRQLLCGGGANEGFFLVMDLERSEFVAEDQAPMHVHDFALDEPAGRIYAVGHGSSGLWELA
jgi:WD40 repeat protein